MTTASATDFAIANAASDGTLSVTDHFDRFGDAYVSISDDHGTIEVSYSRKDALSRIKGIAPKWVA